jgi:hypothetical protein
MGLGSMVCTTAVRTGAVATLALGLGACGGGSPDDQSAAAATPTATTSVEARTAERAGAVAAEVPTDVRLPGGTVVPIRPADTRPDGLLDVPDDIRRSGWWRGGSRVGDPFGSTLLAGHVDSVVQGLGPYAELLTVRAGDRLRLRSAHLHQEFVVRSLRLVPQGSLADNRRLYAVDGPRRLTLVTCAPPYDAERGGYQNLAVVTAAPVSLAHPRTAS